MNERYFEMGKRFNHFHDFYSRTYPKYESYTSREREADLYTMMKTIANNTFDKVEERIYYTPDGSINPLFKQNVLSAIEED